MLFVACLGIGAVLMALAHRRASDIRLRLERCGGEQNLVF